MTDFLGGFSNYINNLNLVTNTDTHIHNIGMLSKKIIQKGMIGEESSEIVIFGPYLKGMVVFSLAKQF